MADPDKITDIATAVQKRAADLQPPAAPPPITPEFLRQCLNNNERGDGCLFATLHRGKFLYNTTPKDGEWYAWGGNVWQRDDFRRSVNAVEGCALEYEAQADALKKEIRQQEKEEEEKIDKTHPDYWKIALRDKFHSRADRLRSAAGANKVLTWAPVVAQEMACREQDFDKQPWLLPVKNGVIDLRTGTLTTGRPDDLLTRALDIEYDPRADYTPWQEFLDEVSGDQETSAFIKRSLGYAITGHSHEQYIWVFTGPGRNGKGVLFDLLGDIMRPYYHVISRAMILEQRSEPSPSAASEHIYSLLGKRIIVGAETNKGQKIDAGAVKTLTGDDDLKCRPNFKSEITFKPSHTLFLHCNHVPVGLTRDFALLQRLRKIEFPFMYVDDPAAEAKEFPAMASRFRLKDPNLKDKLRLVRPGILRWLVEGTREWKELGLSPPAAILDAVKELANEEDYVGRFMRDCLIHFPGDKETRVATTDVYNAFRWWWSLNMDEAEKRIPQMKTINAEMRQKGHIVDSVGGRTWLYGHAISMEIKQDVDAFVLANKR
jgi:putative DNA primase/helicase